MAGARSIGWSDFTFHRAYKAQDCHLSNERPVSASSKEVRCPDGDREKLSRREVACEGAIIRSAKGRRRVIPSAAGVERERWTFHMEGGRHARFYTGDTLRRAGSVR